MNRDQPPPHIIQPSDHLNSQHSCTAGQTGRCTAVRLYTQPDGGRARRCTGVQTAKSTGGTRAAYTCGERCTHGSTAVRTVLISGPRMECIFCRWGGACAGDVLSYGHQQLAWAVSRPGRLPLLLVTRPRPRPSLGTDLSNDLPHSSPCAAGTPGSAKYGNSQCHICDKHSALRARLKSHIGTKYHCFIIVFSACVQSQYSNSRTLQQNVL